MTDEFERMLAAALAPPERDEDHRFVARVSQHVRLDEHLRAQQRGIARRFALQLLSLAAVASAVAALGLSADLRDAMRELPHVGLGFVLVIFAGWVALVASGQRRAEAFTLLNR